MQSQLPLDYVKTAELYIDGLGDRHYAKDLLEQAEELCFEVAEFAAVAHGYALIGEQDKARELLQRAGDEASELADSAQLCMRMKVNGVDIDSVKNVYAAARSNMQNSSQRLQWAEGIMQLFRDREWATREYDDLAGEFTSGIEKQCYLASKKFRLQQSL